ncbi:unnamed protein product [Ectocarpus sp. 12 AP-2014]
MRSKGGQLILFALTVSTGHAGGGESEPALLSANGTCNVCRRITQGFVDLHTEWPLVRSADKEVSRSLRDRGDGDDDTVYRKDEAMSITYEAAIERYCEQSFLSGSQQRVCYSIVPFAAEVGKWLGMGVPPERVCRKLGRRNPETCFDARDAERPSSVAEVALDWRSRPPSIPQDAGCLVEHRNSLYPRWVLLD